jgi:hypothetical protein
MADPYGARKKEQQLRSELSSCLTSYYKLTAFGVLVGLPVSMKMRTYWPFLVTGMIGTGLDFRQAKIDCQSLQDRLDTLLKAKEETEG